MSLIVELSPEVEKRLEQEAERNGLEPPEYVRRLVEERISVGESKTLTAEERATRVAALRGKYAHVPTSADEFCRRKQDEIDVEDRRWKERSR